MKLLLDINVVLDLLLEREPWVADAKMIAQAVLADRVKGCVSAASVGTIYYVIQKQSGKEKARLSIDRMVAAFDVAELDFDAVWDAMKLHGADFEDDLQIASASRAKADLIVTRNIKHFVHSPVPAVDPAEAVRRISALP